MDNFRFKEFLFIKAYFIYIQLKFFYFQYFPCEMGCVQYKTFEGEEIINHYLQHHQESLPFLPALKENLIDRPLQNWYNAMKQFPEPISALLSRPLLEQNGKLQRKLTMPSGNVTYRYNDKLLKLPQLLLLSAEPPYTIDNFSWLRRKIRCEN